MMCIWCVKVRLEGVVHKIRKIPIFAAMQPFAAAACVKCMLCEWAFLNKFLLFSIFCFKIHMTNLADK